MNGTTSQKHRNKENLLNMENTEPDKTVIKLKVQHKILNLGCWVESILIKK